MNASLMSAVVEALGWTLVHFLWQGAVVAAMLWCALKCARKMSPQVRYLASCAALSLMCAVALATFVWQIDGLQIGLTTAPVATTSDIPVPASIVPGSTESMLSKTDAASIQLPMSADAPSMVADQPWTRRISEWKVLASRFLPWIVGFWAAGVGWLSLRLLAGWRQICRLRLDGRELRDALWTDRFQRLRQRLHVSRPVRLLCTAAANVPMVIGWLRPVVLLPAALLTGLSPEQVEAVLAHELAHIRRHDYLVNLVQNVVETLFFYHPAVWWVSGQIRAEREHCCDDVASAVCGDTLEYARALSALEELRHAQVAYTEVTLGVAASGGSLLARVRRLAGASTSSSPQGGWSAAMLVLGFVAVFSFLVVNGSTLGEQQRGDEPPTNGAAESNETGLEEETAINAGKAAPKTEPAPAARNPAKDSNTVTVLDAKDRTPIPKFRVLAGVKSEIYPEDNTGKRIGPAVVAWQDHTVHVGNDGIYFWPLAKAYDVMMLRVEAEGYQPQTSGWINKSTGPAARVFLMAKDPGVKGQVLQPDGKPAAGAIVARVITRQSVHVEHGRLREFDEPLPDNERDKWLRPTMVRADDAGRFQMPTETDPSAAVLVVHDSGEVDMSNVDFQKNPRITLKRWGRIDGRVLWKDKPGANELVHMKVYRAYGYPDMIDWAVDARTDAEGRVTFDKIPPGHVQLYRPIVSETGGWNSFDGLVVGFDVEAGGVTPALVGGQGRKVIGRLTGRDNWDGVTFHFHPDAPHIGFPEDDERWKAFGEFRESAIGPLFFRDKLTPNADGSFEIPNVLPGRYQFFVSAPGVKNYAASRTIVAEPETPGVVPPSLDLGNVAVAAPFVVEDAKAGPVKPQIIIAEHAVIWDGKVVTWDEVLERLRAMRPAGPILPTFHFTMGLYRSKDGWEPWHKRIMDVYRELFEPAGAGFSAISPRGSQRWDAIYTDADLRPDPALARNGKVLAPDGKPAAGAQVVVLPTDGPFAIMGVALQGTQIRDLIDEEWVSAGEDGKFTVSPKSDEHLLAVLHSSGFTVVKGPLTADNSTITVQPWAGVTFESTGGVSNQSASLSIKPAGADGLCPEFQIYGVQVADKPISVPVPAGKVFVQRVLENGDGGGIGLPDQSLILKPGEQQSLSMSPPSDDDRKRADGIRKKSDGASEKSSSSNDSEQKDKTEPDSRDSKKPEPKADSKDGNPGAKSVTIQGKVVDDETGAPVAGVVIQAGKFDPSNPTKVTWGFSESRSSSTDGSFSTTVNWDGGWTARALADGYVPQPLLKSAPSPDKGTIALVIRLKRGRVVRGQVLDHAGQPVKGAAVYTIGAISRNLAGGKAYTDWGEPDQSATPSYTNDSGHFDIPAGDATLIAATCDVFDAWAVPVPEKGDVVITLPEPARVEVDYNIDGADAKGKIFYQFLSHLKPRFERLQSMRELPIDNGGKLVLPALPPGNYQFCRKLMHNLGGFSTSAMLERQFFEVKPGETRNIHWVRDRGARVQGKVTWPEGENFGGIIVAIRREKDDSKDERKKDEPNPLKEDQERTTYASCVTEQDGTFLTERIPPGRYELVAKGYAALTPEQLRSTGFITNSYVAHAVLTVPDSGEVAAPDLRLDQVKK